MEIMLQCQAYGLPPPRGFPNPATQQPVPGATKSVATTRARSTARSHSQPNLPKKSRSSAYSRGVPIPKPVPQPPEAAQYQPPPVKARARRAAKCKAKATSPAASGSTTPKTAAASAGLPPTGDSGQRTLTSPLHPVPSHSALAKAISQQPGLENIPIELIRQVVPKLVDGVKCIKRSKPCIAGDAQTPGTGISNSMPHNESPDPPDMGMPMMEEPGLLPAVLLPGSFTPVVQPEQSPLVDQPQFGGWYPVMNTPEWPAEWNR